MDPYDVVPIFIPRLFFGVYIAISLFWETTTYTPIVVPIFTPPFPLKHKEGLQVLRGVFPEIGILVLEVPIIRTVAHGGLYKDLPFQGNY